MWMLYLSAGVPMTHTLDGHDDHAKGIEYTRNSLAIRRQLSESAALVVTLAALYVDDCQKQDRFNRPCSLEYRSLADAVYRLVQLSKEAKAMGLA